MSTLTIVQVIIVSLATIGWLAYKIVIAYKIDTKNISSAEQSTQKPKSNDSKYSLLFFK